MKLENLVGRRFGRLVVDSFIESRNQKRWWLCKCDCGNMCEVQTCLLTNRSTQSCGCLQKERTSQARREDLTGKTFNGIYVVSMSEKKTSGLIHWNCICHCGNSFVVSGKNLKRGNTKSCGCERYNKAHDRFLDLTGKQYNNLIVKQFVGDRKHKRYVWRCECLLCGGTCDVSTNNLRSGHTTSCGCHVSIAETIIATILDEHKIIYQKQKSFIGCINKKKLRFDYYLPEYGIAIEYDGEFHYRNLKDLNNDVSYQQNNDAIKTHYCDENDIILLRIPYWEKDNIESILNDWLFLYSDEEADSSDAGLSA